MNWSLRESHHDPSADYPNDGSRPVSRARGFAPTSHREGRLTRAIRDIGESRGLGLYLDELHHRTHSAIDTYDEAQYRMRTTYALVDQTDSERVTFLRAKIESCYNKIATTLLEG